VDGHGTLAENIADMGGIKLAKKVTSCLVPSILTTTSAGLRVFRVC